MKKFIVFLLFITMPSAFAYDFSVLSWNVFMLPKPLKSSLQNTRTRIIPQQLKEGNHDLIFLQEAFMSGLRGNVKAALKKSHPHTYYLPSPSIPYPVVGSGLYIVSRYPFKKLGHVYFTNCTDADCLAAKGAVMLEVTLPGGKRVHMINTHLQATRAAGGIRLKQLGQIQKLIAKYGRSDIPKFLIGDLNIDDNEPEFGMGLSLMGMNYARLTGPIRWTTGRKNDCYKAGNSRNWVDHMWFDDYSGISATSMRVRNLEFEYKGLFCPSSDHHAIEAEFHF